MSVALLLVGCSQSSPVSGSAPSSGAAGATVAGGPVTSTITRTGKYLTDDQGRVVIFHGVNIMDKLAPYWPSTLGAADAAFLADEGFNAARIGWIWSAAEPTPGNYDDSYMNHLLGFNELLGGYGIRSFIDFHQDSWSESAGGDGAPDWATLGSSSGADWQAFWNDAAAADGSGIQTRFHALWAHAAALIKTSAGAWNVMGLDPINEPNPGSGYSSCLPSNACPAFETSVLTDFYERVTRAIRGVGDAHIVWREDEPDHFAFTPAFTAAAFSDPQTAYSWHYYCILTELTRNPGGLFDAVCDPETSQAVANETAFGDQMQLPELIGEFGANGADPAYAKQTDAFNAHFLSWTYWVYYSPPGDPADFAAGSILLDSTQPGSQANANQTKLDALVVPYPQAIAGTPLSYAFDRNSSVMTLSYSTTAVTGATLSNGALTQVFVPRRHYPNGYKVDVVGAKVMSAAGAPWLVLRADAGAQTVQVTISPTTAGATALPSQTGIFPLSR